MLAELIEETDLMIWDGAPMTHKHAFDALDKTLKDIMSMKTRKESAFWQQNSYVRVISDISYQSFHEVVELILY